MPSSEGRRLTTPLKVWHHWRLTMQQKTAWCRWLVRTGLRGVCQAAIKWRMTVVYLRMEGEAIKESVVCESTETHSWWACRVWWMAMANKFYEKQCHVFCFCSPFHISSALLVGYLQKWSSFALHYLHVVSHSQTLARRDSLVNCPYRTCSRVYTVLCR